MSGYFADPDQVQRADDDDLEEHDFEPVDVQIKGDGIGPLRAYFESLARAAHREADVARMARERGFDPELTPEIPFAQDLAARVEALVGPPGVAARIRELAREMGREELALIVSKEVAAGKFVKYTSREEALDAAIRAGLAILTEGILVAPLEGVASVCIRRNEDGSECADVLYAGPIRAAGGTAQALSVLIADVVRRELGLSRFQATRAEVERFKEEIPAYKRAAHLQYTPPPEEIELIVSNLPVGVNGEGTDKDEVSGYRDLPRVDTNQLRGGACLVIAEGLTLKAPKILKHVDKLKLEGWEFLRKLVDKRKAADSEETATSGPKIQPDAKYITELVAGRPVFSHPMARGGFRLRYGRARTAGLASTAIHPALTVLVDDFLAVGTQLKIERPGKGTVVTPCDRLEPPIVRLDNGDVVEVRDIREAAELRSRVKVILDLGEILVPFGEFLENNKLLPAAAWCTEWWEQTIEAAGSRVPALADDDAAAAFELAEGTRTPLHPRFTLMWHDITRDELLALRAAVAQGRWHERQLVLANDARVKDLFESLGATHRIAGVNGTSEIVVDERCSLALVRGTGCEARGEHVASARAVPEGTDVLALVSALSGVTIKAKAPCRIGARMGRPEKAAERKMDPPVHVLFPLGGTGGMQRLIKQAAALGEIGAAPGADTRRSDQIEVCMRRCPTCNKDTLHVLCPTCDKATRPLKQRPQGRVIPLADLVEKALARIGEAKLGTDTKGVQGLISEHKLAEPLEKGILRAKHGLYVYKDGTCRFDMTDVPLTHFRPREIKTSVEKLRDLGYERDLMGEPLTNEDQLLELLPQDIVVNEECLRYLAKIANYVDDLLQQFYKVKPYYCIKNERDLVGHLAVGLAPHTSGGVLCRIIGTTRAQVHFGHPYFHAAKRRNCLHPATEVFCFNSPTVRRVRLDELYETTATPAVPVDEIGTLAKPVTGRWVHAADPRTGKVTKRAVTRIYRMRAPRHLLRVRTRSGREVTCSPGHRMEVVCPEGLRKVKAVELRRGDVLSFPGKVSLPEIEAEPIDLLAELPAAGVQGLVLRGVRRWLVDAIATLGGLKAGARAAGVSMKGLDNFRRRDSLPLECAERITRALGGQLADVPADVRLAAKRDTMEIPRMLPVGPELLRLIGYYLAEGHCRASRGNAYQVSFATSEPAMARDIRACLRVVLGAAPRYTGISITVSSRLVHALFSDVLALGDRAATKRIPPRVATLPRALTREMLRAYFAGDGSVERGRLHVTCHSVSRGLLRDVGLQLAARGIAHRMATQTRPAGGAVKEFLVRKGRPLRSFTSHRLSIRSSHAVRFGREIGFTLARKERALTGASDLEGTPRFEEGLGDLVGDPVAAVESVPSDTEWLYDLEVDGHHNFLVNDLLLTSNCDGDEDCVMLLLDGLINFSRWYLPRTRGGQMDAPLTLSLRIDPREIDKEAHNIDVMRRYPLAFYEATERNAHPKEVEKVMETVTARLGGARQYTDLHFTHDTTSIDEGPLLSAYKTIGTMLDKMEGQLSLAHRIRAVDEGNVASRVICDHFLPDIVGNLKAFSRQTVRCGKCNSKYRRIPLAGRCVKCQNKLTLTVHEASVRKYVEVSRKVCAKYNVDDYTLQRLRLVEEAIESLFQNDKVKKATLSDFL